MCPNSVVGQSDHRPQDRSCRAELLDSRGEAVEVGGPLPVVETSEIAQDIAHRVHLHAGCGAGPHDAIDLAAPGATFFSSAGSWLTGCENFTVVEPAGRREPGERSGRTRSNRRPAGVLSGALRADQPGPVSQRKQPVLQLLIREYGRVK